MHYFRLLPYVSHIRYMSNEKYSLFGGIDYNEMLEHNYTQHGIKISNTQKILEFNCFRYPIIGNTFTCNSAFIFLKNKLLYSKEYILIESQYIQHKELIDIIIQTCLINNITLTIIHNNNFQINPYHPCKCNCLLSFCTGKYLKYETFRMLNLIRNSGIKYEFLSYFNSYVHNKIYIIDNNFIIGSFNFHERSLTKQKDLEIGYVSQSKKLINDYKNYIMKLKKNNKFKIETNIYK